MLKVILIDDEIVILQGLKKLIDWSKLELEIVGEAMDGLEGLSLIEEVRPDIVISDITIPSFIYLYISFVFVVFTRFFGFPFGGTTPFLHHFLI